MKTIGTKYNYVAIEESRTTCYGSKKAVNIVFYKDMFEEGGVRLLLNQLQYYAPKEMTKYINTDEVAVRHAVEYEYTPAGAVEDDAVDTENTTAIYACVGEDDDRFYAVIIGIPFPREYSFKDKAEFDKYLERCPFKLRVLKIVA